MDEDNATTCVQLLGKLLVKHVLVARSTCFSAGMWENMFAEKYVSILSGEARRREHPFLPL